MKKLKLLEAFIREEIGRNYHTVNPDPITWDKFQDYEIECFPTGNGNYTVTVFFKGEQLSPTSNFKSESEANHFARMIVDKHRVNVMNFGDE